MVEKCHAGHGLTLECGNVPYVVLGQSTYRKEQERSTRVLMLPGLNLTSPLLEGLLCHIPPFCLNNEISPCEFYVDIGLCLPARRRRPLRPKFIGLESAKVSSPSIDSRPLQQAIKDDLLLRC